MTSNFLGGVWQRNPGSESGPVDWDWTCEDTDLVFRGAASCGRLFSWDGLALFLRGYARTCGDTGPLDLERIAEKLRRHYVETGTLAVDDLDGCFTVALLDGPAERVLLYRNLVGSGFTYYHASGDGLLFGGNLTELTDYLGDCGPNDNALPSFFLFRCVPGRETLFREVYRLLPGEEITWDRRGLRRRQRHTFADFGRDRQSLSLDDAVSRVEETMTAVLRDCAALRPGSANLLSGGVDSSYIQAIWNRVVGTRDELPPSYCVSVDHPHTWGDTDYAVTASQAIGTRHTLVPADGPYGDYLLDALASTGEPLNHVQSAYFGHLARAMKSEGVSAGLCGEGADSLFGVGMANQVHNARVLRHLLPFGWTRSLAGRVCNLVGWNLLARTCRVANILDDMGELEHPVNRVATFTDWDAATACFGRSAVAEAAADRRRLSDLLGVPYDPMDRLHATGFLGEAMDSAGLWATLFNRAGVDLLCPFLDSRMLRLALNLPPALRYPFRNPKGLLKRALMRRAPEPIATRSKLGFGQPIFEWLAPGGQLRPCVDRLGPHIADGNLMCRLRVEKPNWFLYSLVVYDVWRRLFVERTMERPRYATLQEVSRVA